MPLRPIVIVVGTLLASGCHVYTPATLETIHPGEGVRVRLSAEATDRLEAVRFTDDRLMVGTLVQESPAALLFETAVSRNPDPTRGGRLLTQRIDLTPGDILEVERRSVSRARTGALIAGVGAGIGVVVAGILQGGGRGDGGEPPGPEEDLRFPFGLKFRLPF
jgi:hypothetical protein